MACGAVLHADTPAKPTPAMYWIGLEPRTSATGSLGQLAHRRGSNGADEEGTDKVDVAYHPEDILPMVHADVFGDTGIWWEGEGVRVEEGA